MLKKVSFLLILSLVLTCFAACDPYAPPANTTLAPTQSTPADPTVPTTASTTAATEPTAHIHSYFGEAVSATCTEGGYMLHVCACGDQFRDSLTDPLGHSWSEWCTLTYPTEQKEGLQERKCQLCGSTSQQILDKLASDHSHTYDALSVPPTCTQAGYTVYICLCGETYTQTADQALGHSFTDYRSNGDASCTADGTKTAKCDRCEVTSTVTDPGTAVGHSWGDWMVVMEPTQTSEGLQTRHCAACGAEDSLTIEKLPEVHVHVYTANEVPPTCTEAGYTLQLCSCGDSFRKNEVPATGHAWGEWVTTKEPTSASEGLQTRTCKNCGATDSCPLEKLPEAHEHDYTKEKVPATCTESGYTRYTCQCGDTYDEITSEPKGHTWGMWYISIEPTTTAEGQRQRDCQVCNVVEQGTIDVLDSEDSFIFVCWPETIGRNMEACVIIKGQPGVTYDIDVYYKSGISSAKGLENQVADENGYVIWIWKVGPSTAAGTFKIIVSGGGQQQTVYFTVVVE